MPGAIVPPVARLVQSLQPKLQIEIYKHNRTREVLEKINPSSPASFSSWLVPVREAQSLLDRSRPELNSAPPVVYLVALALRFDPATDALLRALSPHLEVARVALTENWRRGLRVVLRQ